MHGMIIGNILLGNILLLCARGAEEKKAASGIRREYSLLYKFLSFSPESCMLEEMKCK